MFYTLIVTASWLLFRYFTGADEVLMDNYRFIPAMTAIILFFLLFSPFNIFQKKERMLFLAYVASFFKRAHVHTSTQVIPTLHIFIPETSVPCKVHSLIS